MTNSRILIATHDGQSSNVLASSLRRGGHHVSLAYTSDDAIQSARQELALLIIDPIMPGFSGLEAAKRVVTATGCKVLFLTDLAEDEDFQDVLNGLARDGMLCTAISPERPPAELISRIEAEIGCIDRAPVPETEASVSSPRQSTESASKTDEVTSHDYDQPTLHVPLFAVANPGLYGTNAFRLTGLKVSANPREVKRAYQEFALSRNLHRPWIPKVLIPTTVEASSDDIEAAFSVIMDPEQRLLQDFFWFWPDGATDATFALLEAGNLILAIAEWERRFAEADPRGIALHNLAVLSHLKALDSGRGATALESWREAFRYWKALTENSRFWDYSIERIRDRNDPRLTPNLARNIWLTLPEFLLYINAKSAVKAGEHGDYDEAAQQRQIIYSSDFAAEFSDKALHRALTPLLEHLTLICQRATSRVESAPEQGAQVIAEFCTTKGPILKTLNCLVGVNDDRRNHAHNSVARTIRGCVIDYVNKTEAWAVALPILEECLALAHEEQLRSKLVEDISVVTGNLAAATQQAHPPAIPETTQSSLSGNKTQSKTPSRANNPARAIPAKAATPEKRKIHRGASNAAKHNLRTGRVWLSLSRGSKVAIGMGIAVLLIAILAISSGGGTTSPTKITTDNNLGGATPPSSPPLTVKDPASKPDQPLINSVQENIAQSKTRLSSLEVNIQRLKSEMGDYQSRIDADKVTLDRIQKDDGDEREIDRDEFERVRSRFNRNVNNFNADLSECKNLISEYNSLLAETNTKIRDFNEMVHAR